MSEAAKEIKFVYQILISMGLKVKMPIIVRVDNVGAMFMSENTSTSQRTRHVDIQYCFVKGFIDEKFLKIIFVKTDENISDGVTKNVLGNIYNKHTPKLVYTKGKLDKIMWAESGRVSNGLWFTTQICTRYIYYKQLNYAQLNTMDFGDNLQETKSTILQNTNKIKN